MAVQLWFHAVVVSLLILRCNAGSMDQDPELAMTIPGHNILHDTNRQSLAPEYENPTEPEEWSSAPIHVSNIKFETGRTCTCNSLQEKWTKWSKCSSSNGQCYRATQIRQRSCLGGCKRIETRYCLHQETCAGRWGPWIVLNATCSKCGVEGRRKSLRLCLSETGTIGPFCAGSDGEAYQTKEESCYLDCDYKDLPSEIRLWNTEYGGDLEITIGEQKGSGGLLNGKSHFVIIILAVAAGILLLALIFVSVVLVLTKRKRKKNRTRGSMSRDFRSISESNISATSYLSVADKESKSGGRQPIYQQHKGGSRRSLMSPYNLASISMLGSGSVRVRGPMQHTDSLMLTRKQINNRRSNKGSLRSINKLMKERNRLDHISAMGENDDGFSIGSINLHEDGEVVVTAGKVARENIPKRRATVGGSDVKDAARKNKYFTRSINMNSSKEVQRSSVSDQEYDEEGGGKLSKSDSSLDSGSMEQNDEYDSSKKRLSVDDIRKIFENRSAEKNQSPKQCAKTTADILQGTSPVGANISRFEQATAASRKGAQSKDRVKKNPGQNVKRSATTVTGPRTIQNKNTTTPVGSDPSGQYAILTQTPSQAIDPAQHAKMKDEGESKEKDCYRTTVQSNGMQEEIDRPRDTNKTDLYFHSNTTKPRKRTFLFSPQAYSSLQRSVSPSPSKGIAPTNKTQSSFKMDIDALMKTTTPQDKLKEGPHTNGVVRRPENNENIRPRSYHDIQGSHSMIVVPTRPAHTSYDSDTYADVWDAKVPTNDQDKDTPHNVYAAVWDSDRVSRTSRTSICEDDDGDYSEVYDSLNSPSINKSSRYPMGSHNTIPRQVKQSPKLNMNAKPSRGDQIHHRVLHGSMSSGSPSPARPRRMGPTSGLEVKRQLSRESSTGSDGSAPQEYRSCSFSFQTTQSHTNHSNRRSAEILVDPNRTEVQEDPIYCVI